jgi:bifunctional DNA-binding transcriptional regulator/antitoxin component of YhaV-PrlF toxin-antitoxin module
METSERKIIGLGQGLLVTLPIGFCRYFNLKAGDIVEITTSDVVTVKPLKQRGTSFDEKFSQK